jgi:hypothetical protein
VRVDNLGEGSDWREGVDVREIPGGDLFTDASHKDLTILSLADANILRRRLGMEQVSHLLVVDFEE